MSYPSGSLTDPKVRKAIREAGPPPGAKDLLTLGRVFVETDAFDMDLLSRVRDAQRWVIATSARKGGALRDSDWEVAMVGLLPTIARLIQLLGEEPEPV